jgi:hypothetical protein
MVDTLAIIVEPLTGAINIGAAKDRGSFILCAFVRLK